MANLVYIKKLFQILNQLSSGISKQTSLEKYSIPQQLGTLLSKLINQLLITDWYSSLKESRFTKVRVNAFR
jgi:hypothetical protein